MLERPVALTSCSVCCGTIYTRGTAKVLQGPSVHGKQSGVRVLCEKAEVLLHPRFLRMDFVFEH